MIEILFCIVCLFILVLTAFTHKKKTKKKTKQKNKISFNIFFKWFYVSTPLPIVSYKRAGSIFRLCT